VEAGDSIVNGENSNAAHPGLTRFRFTERMYIMAP
jgi:hypothetical protein